MMSFRLTNFVFCHPCIEVSSVVANRCADFDECGAGPLARQSMSVCLENPRYAAAAAVST